MPGLVGVVGMAYGTSDAAREMASQLGLGVTPDAIHLAGTNIAAMACDSIPKGLWGPKVATSADGHVAGLNGEIFSLFDDEGLTTETFARGATARPAELLLALYRQYGTEMIARLRGSFSLAIWDALSETLFLATDRYALRPMYYMQCNDKVIFGSEVKALLKNAKTPPPLDDHGIADYLLLGIPFGMRTFFRDINLVPPASIVSIKRRNVTSKQYWQLQFHARPAIRSNLKNATELFAEAFEEALQECIYGQETLEIPLSGGLDSRCLAAFAAASGRNIRTYTIGSAGSDDLRIGPLVAQALEVQNEAWTLTSQDFIDWLPTSIYLTDGMYNPIHSPILSIARRLPSDAQVILDGTNSFDGSYKFYELFTSHFIPWRYSVVKQGLHICAEPVVDAQQRISASVFSRDFLKSANEHIRATFQEMAESISIDHRHNPFDTIDFLEQRNRVRRYNMMGTVLLRAFCEVRHPLFDQRVVDVVTRFLPLFRSKEKLIMGRYLANISQPLSALRYERTGLHANTPILLHGFEYARRAVLRVAGHFIPELAIKKRVAIDYGHWVRNDAKLREYIFGVLLDSRARHRRYFAAGSVEQLIKELFRGRIDYLPLVGRILSIEFWHRFFLEGNPPPKN
jgi:hypothetical protein